MYDGRCLPKNLRFHRTSCMVLRIPSRTTRVASDKTHVIESFAFSSCIKTCFRWLLLQQSVHRPGPLHQTNKAHKLGRHSKKSSATAEIRSKSGAAKTLVSLSRHDRANQLSQARRVQQQQNLNEKRKICASTQAPLLVSLLDLEANCSEQFLDSLGKFPNKTVLETRRVSSRCAYVLSQRLKLRFRLVSLNSDDFDESLDLVKSLDMLLIIHRPNTIDSFSYDSSPLFRAIYIHCLPTVFHLLDARQDFTTSSKQQVLNSKRVLKLKLKDERMHCIEKEADLEQLFHILGNCKRQKSHFKSARPILVPDKAEVIEGSLTFTGFVQHKILSPDQLIHLVGYDDFQISKIDVLADAMALRQESLEPMQLVQTVRPNLMNQESLEQENEIDLMEGEQTWPTAEELGAEAERRNTKVIVKKLPKGTSEYQGAWIADSEDEQDNSSEDQFDEDSSGDAKMDEIPEDEDEEEDAENGSDEEIDEEAEEDENSVEGMELDDYDKKNSNAKELRILEKIKEARFEEMFPDEIDTPSDIPARMRFARYRGLKSFRTSVWDPQENLPPDYTRIFQFQNFLQTKKRVLNEVPVGVNAGQYVKIHLSNVPETIINSVLSKQVPPTLVGLLKHERKMTVLNLVIKKVQSCTSNIPIKSKDELIFYIGYRKMKARPLFTTHCVSSKHKYERFLRDDVAMVATIYAPITFPPAPVLVFKTNYKGEKVLIASGSILDCSPNRLIVKRIRLSGHPFKIHSKSAVIRFMFFNSDDVNYFKPVELITKYNRRGHISEPLGTHGHMKCTFDKKIRSDDCIFMNLYKRVFPKWTYQPIVEP